MSSRQKPVSQPIHPHVQRLSRAQQLTLTTWRFAARKLERVLEPSDLLERVAVHVVLGTLREVNEPIALFARHATAQPEFALVQSLVSTSAHSELDFDVLDTGFLLRWNELVADGRGPEELPPLRRRVQS
jgi:hypothetical protein